MQDKPVMELAWHNLSYVVPGTGSNVSLAKRTYNFFSSNSSNKDARSRLHTILNSLNGSIKSGELAAVMGPSGSGKTTLLECLAGKRQLGVTGDITFTGCDKIKLSFISQNDQLLSHMTVRESIMFASKLKNFKRNARNLDDSNNGHRLVSLDVIPNDKIKAMEVEEQVDANGSVKAKKTKKVGRGQFDHSSIVQRLLEQFGLLNCADVRVSNISGGQMKRLSIAQELVSKPNLLILDEPTSGLDSAACCQTIELLQKLAQQKDYGHPLAIVATIHQPSARVFNMFQQVYFLSMRGECIYQGAPSLLVPHLAAIGLNCPTFNNPADYMTEIASEDYGLECISKLSAIMHKKNLPFLPIEGVPTDVASLEKKLKPQQPFPFFEHISLLFHRTFLSILRDPMLTGLRLVSHVLVALFIGLLYGNKIGNASGCPPSYTLETVGSTQKHLYDDIVASSENVANLFFTSMFVMYGAMLPTVLTFPMELHVFLKERCNGWYHCRTYYLAKTLADIPLQIAFPIIYGSIVFYMNGQLFTWWRFSMFITILILVGLVAQSQGLMVSAIFMNDPTSAVFVAPMTSIPFLLFAGFFVRIKTMPGYLVIVSYFSYIRYSFEALISLTYGFDRCVSNPLVVTNDGTQSALFKFLSVFFTSDYEYEGIDINGTMFTTEEPPSKKLIQSIVKDFQENNPFISDVFTSSSNTTNSYVLNQYDLSDYSLYLNLFRLVCCFVTFRVVSYIVLLWKTSRRR